VQLAGEFAGSAFTDRQWLIERDGHFIQVPELLYRVAEYANGERTPGEIASLVTESTEWTATAGHVGVIIAAKLIPLGIIMPAGDDASVPPATRLPAPSPLVLRMRRKVLGPGLIDPVTGVLQFLYAPAILIPVLIAAVAAHGWLYLHHGLAASIRDLAYTPGALVAVLALLTLAAAFHEFGHAAALRRGGGRVRSMGVGLYLIFPAFYTDTTDSYRLGRWARVRTDLGGFYFHLIFTLAIIAGYFALAQEWLLVLVFFVDLDIARQLLPFVRFDGYWALTDLVGIPDILSQMRIALMRRVRRGGARAGGAELKPWARPILAAYTLVTTPILVLLLVLLLVRGPLAVAALSTSLRFAAEVLVLAWSRGQIVSGITAGLMVALLALQVFAVAFVLYTLVRGAFRALWRWSQPSRRRRVATVVFSGVAIALLATYWNSSLGLTSGGVPAGVQTFPISQRFHVQGPVTYPQSPPVGGAHSPIWENCGFYRTPIAKENGVHSLEHGAVWITYRPDLPAGELAALRVLAVRQSDILVSPYPGLPAPVVASAWGRQLRLNSAGDPRLDQFLRAFRRGSQAPEHRGGPCTGGLGSPER
jgi:putative peptide zinc metalloprotease protein